KFAEKQRPRGDEHLRIGQSPYTWSPRAVVGAKRSSSRTCCMDTLRRTSRKSMPGIARTRNHEKRQLVVRQVKTGKGGKDVGNILETFGRDPAGNQSCPVEPGQQPEASLASTGVIRTAKRRQRVHQPCD